MKSRTFMVRISNILGAACLAAVLAPAAIAQGDIRVRIDGQNLPVGDVGAQEVRGRVMVPLRGVLERMGAYVGWDSSTRTVIASRGNMDIRLPIGSTTAEVNGRTVALDVPAMTYAGTTLVPLRFVSETLGANVQWDSGSRTVMIDTQGGSIADTRPAPADIRRTDAGRAHRTVMARSVLPSGTVIPVRLDEPLGSRTSRVGDRFTATVIHGPNDANLPVGTKVEGVVREAIPSANGKPGVLDVDFRRIVFPNGDSKVVGASLISLDDRKVTRNEDGRLVAKGSNSNDRLKWVGIGAGAGLIVGALTKQNSLLSILLGAGAGYLYNELQNKRPGDVNLGSGSEFGVRLDRQLAYLYDRGAGG